ncbi:hypothetical protein, partial [Mycobacteroides abscessus]|uniref:hypothetical protein n=1 Tax=Mycobacteroides abscessus TaxID=36809 RepID=UPI001A996BCC
ANAGLDQKRTGLVIIPGKARPHSRRPTKAHPQVLIIAPFEQELLRDFAAARESSLMRLEML